MDTKLSLRDASALAAVIDCKFGDRKVARLIDGKVYVGEPRSIGTANGLIDHDSDVRDQYWRITLAGGVDTYWKISDLMSEYCTGEFVTDYRGDVR